MNFVVETWARLGAIRSLRFESVSRTGIGWSGQGSGQVEVSSPAEAVLVFHESGSWTQNGGRELRFSNVYRWSLGENSIALEHLRFGIDKPVWLFQLAPDKNGLWREDVPHPCRDDCYSATMRIVGDEILLEWQVRGPKRNETISYIYT